MRHILMGLLVLAAMGLTACTGRFVKPDASDQGLAAHLTDRP